MHKFKKTLFIFHRDLRLEDNTGLIQALKLSEYVIPCFIFDPIQISDHNEYKSNNAVQFMIESIEDLEKQLAKQNSKLYLYNGDTQKIVTNIIESENIDAIFTNRDYTPFAINREETIKHICNKHSIAFEQFNDLLLTEPEDILTGNNDPYSIFTPFFKKASKKVNINVTKNDFKNYYIKLKIANFDYKKLNKNNSKLWVNGGRTNSQKILKNLHKFDKYKNERDYPAKNTTNLAAHIKFGTSSIREIYKAIEEQLGYNHLLIQQLFWRDFFTHIAYNSPFVFGSAYKEKYNKLQWSYNNKKFQAWCNGQTGFPIVDAGMRQLNETGYMHNRVRMVVASFLVKDLHIDWRLGEKYFAQKLVDYDPAVNNGNWQWCASTGADSQPYFRIFNPWLQQKKFDPECEYIKKWVPELKNQEPKVIHKLYDLKTTIKSYPKPIVDHSLESKLTKKQFKNVSD